MGNSSVSRNKIESTRALGLTAYKTTSKTNVKNQTNLVLQKEGKRESKKEIPRGE